MRISKGPYEVDSEETCGAYGPHRYYKLLDADGKVIADTLNSEVACIEREDDEDGCWQWDEQGRVDLKAIAVACNAHATLVELARFAISEAHYLPHTLAELKAKAEAALGTISPSSETIVGKIGTNGAETGTPDLLAAIEFAFLHTRGIIAIDKQGQGRLTEARDRLNLAMVHAGHDWKPAAARAESGAQQ